MRLPTAALCTALALLGANGTPRAQTLHGPAGTAAAVLAAERAFAQESVARGAGTAFRDFMDPTEGLEFGSAALPDKGAAAIAAGVASGFGAGVLNWTPTEVFASTGDMAAVWGHWVFQPKQGAALHGHYVTVWRRSHTAWKALMDIGGPDP